ncbi:hypothetical protein Pcinc_005585 [Petrolisthes cinctipes]|uniref:Endonuclease/exonuclease/phosphatase domain-containing protein n=1 Tax=Petrolisthes cinctipes TaxID=88211 RepID=A0AAE1GD45_PETCI|nr:hypothetical protein Pcinc_005585 [Petrolisthes cinctipes]
MVYNIKGGSRSRFNAFHVDRLAPFEEEKEDEALRCLMGTTLVVWSSVDCAKKPSGRLNGHKSNLQQGVGHRRRLNGVLVTLQQLLHSVVSPAVLTLSCHWIQMRQDERVSIVGFAIRTQHLKKLASIPEGFNDRLMKLKLPLGRKRTATLISAYAPTITNPEETKDGFYEELDAIITAVPQSDKLIVLSDFNACVGTDHQAWDKVIRRHGVGKCLQ